MLTISHLKSVLLSCLLLQTFLAAEDRIKIKFSSGYPLPNQSQQTNEIIVSRSPDPSSGKQLDVDVLFSTIETLLRDKHAPAKWYSVGVDYPYVEMNIAIGAKHYAYTFGYSPTFTPVTPNSSDLDAKMERVTREILKLSKNHIARFYDIK